MPQKTLGGVAVDVDDEGYMTNHAQWNREVAAALATEENSRFDVLSGFKHGGYRVEVHRP